mmetsp:Transcript_46664/g.107838  ORF Transcript_46664/g.107838 Transcript_46664/m.107838 type:complete len:211 (-) Transcript_46664:2067-2699(-)
MLEDFPGIVLAHRPNGSSSRRVDLTILEAHQPSYGDMRPAGIDLTSDLCQRVASFQPWRVHSACHLPITQHLSHQGIPLACLQHDVGTAVGWRQQFLPRRHPSSGRQTRVFHILLDLQNFLLFHSLGIEALWLRVQSSKAGEYHSGNLFAVDFLSAAQLKAAGAVDTEPRALLSAPVEDELCALRQPGCLRQVILTLVQCSLSFLEGGTQ